MFFALLPLAHRLVALSPWHYGKLGKAGFLNFPVVAHGQQIQRLLGGGVAA